MTDERQMHLNALLIFTPMMHAIGSWAEPGNRMLEDLTNLHFWQELARTVEDSQFDMMFFADHFAPYDVYNGGDRSIALEYGVQLPALDPLFLIPAMAAATSRLGFGATMSTTFYPPFLLVRKMSTLDHLTGGRIGWNVVSSYAKTEARALGLKEMVPHDERYVQAEEYMDVCYQLWDSWAPDAVIADRASLRLVDPERVHYVTHEGRYFDIDAPSSVHSSPQRRPLILQAGASPAGRDFAAHHAEVIFAIKRSEAEMAAFVEDMERRAAAVGRARSDFKIVFGVQLVQGRTDEEAHDRRADLLGRVNLEAALAKLSGTTGVDWAGVELDAPLERITVPGVQGVFDMFTGRDSDEAPLTLRQAAIEYGASAGCPQVVGGPDTIAAELERLFVQGRGDGFLLTPSSLPDSYIDFRDEVAPRLQKAGRLRTERPAGTLRDVVFG